MQGRATPVVGGVSFSAAGLSITSRSYKSNIEKLEEYRRDNLISISYSDGSGAGGPIRRA